MVTHHRSSPRIDSPMKAMPVSALSAIGSASLPKLVTRSYLRASLPSTKSVRMATTKIAVEPTRQPTESGCASSAQAKTGTMTSRSTVSALGTFQELTLRGVGPGAGSGHATARQVGAVAARHDRVHERPHHSSMTDLQRSPNRRPPVPGARPGRRSRRVALPGDLLDEHADALADPVLGALADQLVGQVGHAPRGAPRSRRRRAGRRGRPPRCRPRRSSRRRRSRRAGRRRGTPAAPRRRPRSRPGNPQMTLLRMPAAGRPRGCSRSAPGTTPGRRTGASGAAPPGAACWKDRSKYGATCGSDGHGLDQARAHLGRLQVGDPDPLEPVDRRRGRRAATPAAGCRRGPCRRRRCSR